MHWTVAAPFIHSLELSSSAWLTPYVPGNRHSFTIVPHSIPLQNWHDRRSATTSFHEWVRYGQQAIDALQQAQGGGVIVVFPQLAATVGILQQLAPRPFPVVAWLFNIGTCYGGWRRQIAQLSLRRIDRFVVHTKREREIYSEWLQLPIERFEFVPYQVSEIPITHSENTEQPFLVALGSAHRDFATLFAAVDRLKLPTVVASGTRALEGFTIPTSVQTPFGISKQDCLQLAQEARINIVPLLPNAAATAAGQVTIVEAMRMKRALIVTRCNGAEDYVQDGKTGLLVEPNSIESLVEAIQLLWNDADLRQRLGEAAGEYAAAHFSDEAAGQSLGRILDKVADQASYC
ncbi:glycosyltransferase [Microcoleus sp. FACHB-1515]|uniref:glycosyltransferase n=1 Tax=Cyanophyceae TaxID=3028117 RepID=UPI0016851E48|nr:glycosyltransferase [Microcoleus sp. FACHB-1515]MBD2089493.1 glycosyltransferase [Microcoleus sp. FACHB-1515]